MMRWYKGHIDQWSGMNKLYRNKEWLYHQYCENKLLQKDIAKICRVYHLTIKRWLVRLNITLRSMGENNHLKAVKHCQLSSKAIEWIDGELLGDAGLTEHTSYSARLGYGSKYREYIDYISKTLNSFGILQSGKIYKNKGGFGDVVYLYHSCYYEELLPINKSWYPQGKKIVPRNIKLTPLTCRHWYLGDGSLCYPPSKKCNPYITMCTNGFSISDVKWLIKQLVDLGFKATRQSHNNTIRISTYSTQDFLKYIGKCPVECYRYKWGNYV